MKNSLQLQELKKIYQILKAYEQGQIINPSEDWEINYYEEPLPDKNGLKQTLKKIEVLLPKIDVKRYTKTVLRGKYGSYNNEISQVVYKRIEKAFITGETLEIGYFDMDSADVIKRRIDIYYKSRKYVIAYCHLRKDLRKFRTSRIVSAKLTGKKYNIPKDFNKSKQL